ncbi:MAG TPA: RNA polymerase sigma factor [Candidatus Limnocylindrales bacterium]|nr:RNA polymerase sigma factor [Candidatus Limnocylindrales bacterium]
MDPDCIRRAQGGDVRAFAELIEGRVERMVRTAAAILGSDADANDVVQDALLAAWRQLPSLRDVARFDAWLTSILLNGCRRALRTRGRRFVREIPAQALAEASDGVDLAGAIVRRRALERAFDRLGPTERSILVLHHLDGRPLDEIAAVLGVPVGPAKSRLFAARRALQRALEREDA